MFDGICKFQVKCLNIHLWMNEHKRRERRKNRERFRSSVIRFRLYFPILSKPQIFRIMRPSATNWKSDYPSHSLSTFLTWPWSKLKKTFFNNGPSRPFLDLCFPFSRYIVTLQLINLNMVNDERKQEKKRKSIHPSIACY